MLAESVQKVKNAAKSSLDEFKAARIREADAKEKWIVEKSRDCSKHEIQLSL